MTTKEEPGLEAIGTVPVCTRCGSERIVTDAWACWNREAGFWELETHFDQAYCHACEAETQLASALLEQTGVAVIGGPDFGILGEGYIRLSYANSQENIASAIDRVRGLLDGQQET